MFCKNCGNEISDNAIICPNCGVQTGEIKKDNSNSNMNIMAIVGFALSFVVSIAGLICSIIAYKQIKENGENGKGFAIAGIAVSAASMAIVVFAIIISVSVVGCTVAMLPAQVY